MENDEAVLTGGREAAGRLQIPFWLKSNLTVDEAAAYSGIGRNKIRELTDSESCSFVLWVGNKRLIKRRMLPGCAVRSSTSLLIPEAENIIEPEPIPGRQKGVVEHGPGKTKG